MTRIRLGQVPADVPPLPGAACHGTPLAWFFPDQEGGRLDPETVEKLRGTARGYCLPCPVRARCAVVGESMQHGMWGGVLRRPNAAPIDLLAEVTA